MVQAIPATDEFPWPNAFVKGIEMTNNEIAKELASLGRRKRAAIDQLDKIAARECELLQGLATTSNLDEDASAEVAAPKIRPD